MIRVGGYGSIGGGGGGGALERDLLTCWCSFFAFLGAVGTWVTTGLRYDVTMIIIVFIIIVGV